MRKSTILFLGLIIGLLGFSQQSNDSIVYLENQLLSVNQLIYNFGTIDLNDKAKFKFELVNKGDDPLIIKHVTTSCQCTSPSFTKKPIAPNEKAYVKVKYDSSTAGSFNKSVLVYTNRQEKPLKLQIRGMVRNAISTNNKSEKGVSKVTPKMQNTKPNTSK